MVAAVWSSLLALVGLVVCAQAQPQLSCPNDFCPPPQPALCTCNASGAALVWRVFYLNGTQAGEIVHFSGSLNDDLNTPFPLSNGIDFVSTLTANTGSAITGNLSFTPAENYTVRCVDGSNVFQSSSINIPGPPAVSPTSLSFSALSFSSASLSWSSLSSVVSCFAGYQLDVNQTIINSSSVPYTITNRMRGDTYCYTVAAVDTANRLGPASDSNCFNLDVLGQPILMSLRADGYPTDVATENTTVNISVRWMQPPFSFRPPVLQYEVIHNVTTPDTTITVSAPTSTLNITEATVGSVYTVQVLASNVLGIGPPTTTTIPIPFTRPPPPISSTVTSTVTPTTSVTPTENPKGGLSAGAIAGIAIAFIVVGIMLIFVGVLILYCCVLKKKGKGGNEAGSSGQVAPQQDDQPNYSQVEHGKKSSSSGSRQKPQEPSVQYSADSQQLQYAELSHASSKGSSIKPQPKGPQVQYSSVKPH